jgi:hypothetical protein
MAVLLCSSSQRRRIPNADMERQNKPDLQASRYRLGKICDNQHRMPCMETGVFTMTTEAAFAILKFMQRNGATVGRVRRTPSRKWRTWSLAWPSRAQFSIRRGAYVQQGATREQDGTSILRQLKPKVSNCRSQTGRCRASQRDQQAGSAVEKG